MWLHKIFFKLTRLNYLDQGYILPSLVMEIILELPNIEEKLMEFIEKKTNNLSLFLELL